MSIDSREMEMQIPLKTLKELNEYNDGESAPIFPDGTLSEDMVSKEELRQLAIQWIKALEHIEQFPADMFTHMLTKDYGIDHAGQDYVVDWIKYVFNITDEEVENIK